jgi:SAM-dependent methyltransferase
LISYDRRQASDWRALGTALYDSGYTTQAVRDMLKIGDPAETVLADIARYSLIYSKKLEKINNELSVITKLFFFCRKVGTSELDLLRPDLRFPLRQLGLITLDSRSSEAVRGTVAMTEYDGRYFCSDRIFEHLGEHFELNSSEDACMPLHASSLELLKTLRRPPGAESFLDVGCGTGCQSILFAGQYKKVFGFDPNPHCIQYATANSHLNNVQARYVTAGWESITAFAEPYHHIAFNAPSAQSAFDFIADGCQRMLGKGGIAQVWTTFEVSSEDGDAIKALEHRLRLPDGLELAESVWNPESPFALSQQNIAARRLPVHYLPLPRAVSRRDYLDGLAERGVIEVASVTLNLYRR